MHQDRFGDGTRKRIGWVSGVIAGAVLLAGAGWARGETIMNTIVPIPLPAQVPAKEGLAPVAGTRLWYWDTGGEGAPVVLLHPASGSGLIWSYQQPAFAKAGYRVIGYSRRSYFNSDPIAKGQNGTGAGDLHELIGFLGLGKVHLV